MSDISSPTPTSTDGCPPATTSPRCCPTCLVTWVTQPLTARTTTCTPRPISWPPTPTSPPNASPCYRRWDSDETRPTYRRTGLLRVCPRLSARLPAQDQRAVAEND